MEGVKECIIDANTITHHAPPTFVYQEHKKSA
jgi:hypothetical protein